MQHNTSWTRDNSSNNFLYDGGSEINTTTNWYDLPARNYDPALGRFFQIDPLAHADHTLTPFHYAGNNPIGFNDPTGLIKRYDANGGMGDWEDDAGDGPVRHLDGGGGESGGTGVTRNIGRSSLEIVLSDGAMTLTLPWNGFQDGYYSISFNGHVEYFSAEAIQSMGIAFARQLLGMDNWVPNYFAGARLWQAGNGDYVQSNGRGGWNVAYTNTSYEEYLATQNQTWLQRHYYAEFRGDFSAGVQATLNVIPDVGIVPGPYSNQLAVMSINAKLFAYTIVGRKISTEGKEWINFSDENINHGLGISAGGAAAEFNIESFKGRPTEYTLKGSLFNGWFGTEINFTKGQIFFGSMPNFSWTMGAGGSASVKFGALVSFDELNPFK